MKMENSNDFRLQFSYQLAHFPFIGHSFNLQIVLVKGLEHVVNHQEIPFKVELCAAGKEDVTIPMEDVMTINPTELKIRETGLGDVSITFLPKCLILPTKRFVLRFTVDRQILRQLGLIGADHHSLNGTNPIVLMTQPFSVMKYRLAITIELNNTLPGLRDDDMVSSGNGNTGGTEDGNGDTERSIWYKDEGGKEHAIDVLIRLIDCDGGAAISGIEVPFTMSLQYESGILCQRQDIVQLTNPPHSASLPPLLAAAVIGKDVSNGGSVSRPVQMMADAPSQSLLSTNSSLGGVSGTSPVMSGIIDPRTGTCWKRIRINDISKNHQRQAFRLRFVPDLSKAPTLLYVGGDESRPIEVRSKRTKRQREQILSALTGINTVEQSNERQGMVNSNLNSSRGDNEASGKTNNRKVKNEEPIHSQPLKKPKNSTSFSSFPRLSANDVSESVLGIARAEGFLHDHNRCDVPRVVKATVEWLNDLAHSLEDLRWQPIGYELSDQNDLDTSRVLYSMKNPNETVDRILRSFMARLQPALGALIYSQCSAQPADIPGEASMRFLNHGYHDLPYQYTPGYHHTMLQNHMKNHASLMLPPMNHIHAMGLSSPLNPVATIQSPTSATTTQSSPNVMSNIDVDDVERDVRFIISSSYDFVERRLMPNVPTPNFDVFANESSAVDSFSVSRKRSFSEESLLVRDTTFPAFDKNYYLLGFYQERKDQRGATVLVLSSLTECLSRVRGNCSTILQQHLETLQSILRTLVEQESPSVHRVNPDIDGSLHTTKQNALIQYWLAEVGLEDI